MTTIKRAFKNTFKQIKRSGWLAVASVFVMTLAFFISSIFIMIAYTSNLFLKSIENKPHIYVFFKSGTPEEEIIKKRDEWSGLQEVSKVEYTSETQALDEFKNVQERVNPDIAETIRSNVLPPSLGIRLFSISDADTIITKVTQEQEANANIFAIRFSRETIDTISTLFYWLRLGGGIIMGLLLVVIFFFTLLTVEFRTFIRSEEIGIMQLVGGSLWFIRFPFMLEGMVYGIFGSIVSTLGIYTLGYYIFVLQRNSNAVVFIYNLLGGLNWPNLDILDYILGILFVAIFGAFVGIFNSFIAIRRYIN